MKIETKFNREDKVWVLLNKKIYQAPVRSIRIEIDPVWSVEEKVIIETVQINNCIFVGPSENQTCHIISETDCFSSEDELIQSLKN